MTQIVVQRIELLNSYLMINNVIFLLYMILSQISF